MQPHFGTAHHQAVAHIVAGIAHVSKVDALQLAEMLTDGQKIGQDLGGVELVGKAVPHAHAGILGQLLYDLLPVAAVLDAVKHTAQHTRGIGNALLFADLAAAGVKIGGLHSQIMRSHLKGAAGAGAGFFKNQRNVFAPQGIVGNAGLLFCLEIRSKIQHCPDLLGGKIQQL